MNPADIFIEAIKENRNPFEYEAYRVLESYGIPVPKWGRAGTVEELLERCNTIGYPVALKAVSPHIIHKSDMDAVVLNLESDKEAEKAFLDLKTRLGAADSNIDLRGVLVAEMMPKGREVIVGMVRDPQFGPAVLFGLGGVFVEVLKDVSYRVAPVTEKDARKMICEIKGYPLLKGLRNVGPSDTDILADIIQKISKLADEHPDIAELDLNPVLVYEKGACVVDARIILNPKEGLS